MGHERAVYGGLAHRSVNTPEDLRLKNYESLISYRRSLLPKRLGDRDETWELELKKPGRLYERLYRELTKLSESGKPESALASEALAFLSSELGLEGLKEDSRELEKVLKLARSPQPGVHKEGPAGGAGCAEPLLP